MKMLCNFPESKYGHGHSDSGTQYRHSGHLRIWNLWEERLWTGENRYSDIRML